MPLDLEADKCGQFIVKYKTDPQRATRSTASTLHKFFWLHIPKCGSTWEVSLYLWACPAGAYLSEDSMKATLRGYYNHSTFLSGVVVHMKRFFTGQLRQRKVWCDAFDIRSRPHEPLLEKYHGYAMVLLRDPRTRLISAFKNHLHCFGIPTRDKLNQVVDAAIANNSDGKGILRGLEAFANWPSVAGCQTKMMVGMECCWPVGSQGQSVAGAGAKAGRITTAAGLVDYAIEILLDTTKTPFFGITDLYAPSVCLFHAMHGGKLWDVELHNIHATTQHMTYYSMDSVKRGPSTLQTGGAPHWDVEGFRVADPHDQRLFNAARKEFQRRVVMHRRFMAPCCEAHGCADYFRQVIADFIDRSTVITNGDPSAAAAAARTLVAGARQQANSAHVADTQP